MENKDNLERNGKAISGYMRNKYIRYSVGIPVWETVKTEKTQMSNVMMATLSGGVDAWEWGWTERDSVGFPLNPQVTTGDSITVNSPLCDMCHFSAGGPSCTLDTFRRAKGK